jgi:ATP-dependent helicase/DNAse subunit B
VQKSLFPDDAEEESDTAFPGGLLYLERQLFRPLRRVQVSDDASGVEVIEAPGVVGEVRLVARRIKTLLRDGVAADDVVVAARDLATYAAIVHELFDEYAIPTEVEGTEALNGNPAVAFLLRTARLPDDGWPFAGVTAMLRNTYFRPSWPQVCAASDLPQRSDALLRLLGEPRGREAYLRAVDRWAQAQQPGLEDETAQESRRRRTHLLARQCQPFLHRFFQSWDEAPGRATLGEHTAWLERFAADCGLTQSAAATERDQTALALLLEELKRWHEAGPTRVVDRKTFLRRLAVLAAAAGLPRTPEGPGRVRVLSATQARHLEAEYLFVVGLGERGFPRLTPPPSLFDDSERQALAVTGLPPAGTADLLQEEMLLFYQVVTRPRRGLVLSYPAVDEQGQALLAGSFLSAVLACFQPGAVSTERRNLLIEGYDRDEPLSAAEHRVGAAASCRHDSLTSCLPGDIGANLADAAKMVRLRFHEKTYNPYDGHFHDPAVIADVARLFGPRRVFSPTALEDYVACPFKFFLRHGLGLESLEEPREGIEMTRRGQAFHRALARLHRRLKDEDVCLPDADDAVSRRAQEEMARAVEEDIRRAPSPGSRELWRLEGQRLLRLAGRYGAQWQRFVQPWRARGVSPRPHLFEIDFGLPAGDGVEPHAPLVIRVDDLDIRISGRIDRVDLVDLPDGTAGFWIIDYKTGRSEHYTSADLSSFRRLQLTLYALAVEEVLLAGRPSRPLGLAYWMVGEKGPKVVLPLRNDVLWLMETARWRAIRETLLQWVSEIVAHIRKGDFPLQPRSDNCTATCEFGQVCRIAQARHVEKTGGLELPVTVST